MVKREHQVAEAKKAVLLNELKVCCDLTPSVMDAARQRSGVSLIAIRPLEGALGVGGMPVDLHFVSHAPHGWLLSCPNLQIAR